MGWKGLLYGGVFSSLPYRRVVLPEDLRVYGRLPCIRKSLLYGRLLYTEESSVRKSLPCFSVPKTGLFGRLFPMEDFCVHGRAFRMEDPSVGGPLGTVNFRREILPYGSVLRAEASSVQKKLPYARFFARRVLPHGRLVCTGDSSVWNSAPQARLFRTDDCPCAEGSQVSLMLLKYSPPGL